MRRRSGVTDGPREAMAGSSGTCFRIDVAEYGLLTGSLSKGRLCSSLLQPRQASALAELQRGYGRNGNCSAPTWSFSLRFAMESEAEKVETFETRPRTPHRKRRQGSWRFFCIQAPPIFGGRSTSREWAGQTQASPWEPVFR